ncbi:hypothetical protein ACLB1O_16905 [Escherichia coli]
MPKQFETITPPGLSAGEIDRRRHAVTHRRLTALLCMGTDILRYGVCARHNALQMADSPVSHSVMSSCWCFV